MKYIKTFENYTPIKINSAKPFKVKKGLLKNAIYLQKGIKSDKKRPTGFKSTNTKVI